MELANGRLHDPSGSVRGEKGTQARRIDTGMVHINDQPINDERHVPLGGVKRLGLERDSGESILDSRIARSTARCLRAAPSSRQEIYPFR